MTLITRRQGLALLAAAAATPFMPHVARAQAKPLVLGVQFGLPYLGFLVAESRGLFKKHAEAEGADVVDDPLLLEDLDRGDRRGTGQRVA